MRRFWLVVTLLTACDHAASQQKSGVDGGGVVDPIGGEDFSTGGGSDLAASDMAISPSSDLAGVDLTQPSTPPLPIGDWEWLNPKPMGESLLAVWSDGTQVWTVG